MSPIENRFTQFPRDLAARAKSVRFGDIPTILAHPDWERPAPLCIWLHGRTAFKELDPGRYLRWIRAGIAACAIDLPGHGERSDPELMQPDRSLEVLAQAIAEIDPLIAALRASEFAPNLDFSRIAIGGMSLGGMATLRRLCEPHPFSAAAVEGTTGWLEGLYFAQEVGLPANTRWSVEHDRTKVRELDPSAHLANFAPIPLLALHSQTDEMVPFAGQTAFIERLRAQYRAKGANPALVEFLHWPETGAPQEHIGFGRFSNDAKNAQTEFLARTLGR